MTVTIEEDVVFETPDVEKQHVKLHAVSTEIVCEVEKSCRWIVSSLTDKGREHAARSSYRYLMASTAGKASAVEREKNAVAMARRHLIAENGDKELALAKMKATIQYRIDMDVDGLRMCFDAKEEDPGNEAYAAMREGIEAQMESGKFVVRGYDKENRAMLSFFPRLYTDFSSDWYLKAKIYMLGLQESIHPCPTCSSCSALAINRYLLKERALACMERRTDGGREKVVVFFDYKGYTSKNAPPLSLAKSLMFCLRDHYPERLEQVFVLDAPLIFRAFWVLIRPFIDPVTKSKVQFVTGEDAKRETLIDLISENQAMPFMYPGGCVTEPYDPKAFLKSIPFDHAFGDN